MQFIDTGGINPRQRETFDGIAVNFFNYCIFYTETIFIRKIQNKKYSCIFNILTKSVFMKTTAGCGSEFGFAICIKKFAGVVARRCDFSFFKYT